MINSESTMTIFITFENARSNLIKTKSTGTKKVLNPNSNCHDMPKSNCHASNMGNEGNTNLGVYDQSINKISITQSQGNKSVAGNLKLSYIYICDDPKIGRFLY